MSIRGLVCAALLVGLAFRAACALAGMDRQSPRDLAPEFLISLVPIAFATRRALLSRSSPFRGSSSSRSSRIRWGRAGTCSERRDFVPNVVPFSPEHDLVRPGRSARGRTRDRSRGGPRPRRLDLRGSPRRASHPVPDARPDGALHRRWALDPVPTVTRRLHLLARRPSPDLGRAELAVVVGPIVAFGGHVASRAPRRRARRGRHGCATSTRAELALQTNPPYSRTAATAENAALPPSPSPATVLPSAAATIPAGRGCYPSAAAKPDASATPTAATVPAVFPTIASPRAGNSRGSRARPECPSRCTDAVSGAASAIPTARPQYSSTHRHNPPRPTRSSEPAPSQRRREQPAEEVVDPKRRAPARGGAPGERARAEGEGGQRRRPGQELGRLPLPKRPSRSALRRSETSKHGRKGE